MKATVYHSCGLVLSFVFVKSDHNFVFLNFLYLLVYYFIQVLDVNVLIKPRMEEHKAKQVELHKQEALESAIATVQAKIREKEESKCRSTFAS